MGGLVVLGRVILRGVGPISHVEYVNAEFVPHCFNSTAALICALMVE